MNKNRINSLLFLDYMLNNGFNPRKCRKVLELFQSANGSISQHLKNNDSYLLSKNVDYSEIDSIGIDGAYGFLDEKGTILVPKSIINDDRFLVSSYKSLYKRHIYETPTIDEFDTTIGYNMPLLSEDYAISELYFSLVHNLSLDKYFGLCIDLDSNSQIVSTFYSVINKANNDLNDNIYTIKHDTVSSIGKELCLVKKR